MRSSESSFSFVWLAPDYTPLKTSPHAIWLRAHGLRLRVKSLWLRTYGSAGCRSGQLGDPERGILFRQIARPADIGTAALEVLPADGAVELPVPDLLDRLHVQVPEDRLTVEVGAAERDPAIPEDRE